MGSKGCQQAPGAFHGERSQERMEASLQRQKERTQDKQKTNDRVAGLSAKGKEESAGEQIHPVQESRKQRRGK